MKKILFLICFIFLMHCCILAPKNEAPLIQNIYSNPDKVYSGDTTQLICEAIDKDNNELFYKWSSIEGVFLNGQTSEKVTWEAPIKEGTSKILVEVSDGEETVKSFIDIFVEFKCGQKIKYYDKIYNTVLIGKQCWFKENLDLGNMIKENINSSNNNVIEKYCYGNISENCDKYGALYQWNEAMLIIVQKIREYALMVGIFLH